MVGPRLERLGEISLDGIAELASQFKASVIATAIRTVRVTRQPLILVAHNLLGRMWQWPSITAGQMRVRDDVDAHSSAFVAMMGGQQKRPPYATSLQTTGLTGGISNSSTSGFSPFAHLKGKS
jgi:hypothetical protein